MKKLLFLFLITAHTCSYSQFNATWGNRFQTVLDSVVTANNIKGASAGVLTPTQGMWQGVSGESTAGVPVTADMRFGVASNTKLFIAVLTMKLQELGILSLDDELHQWLPTYPNIDSTITIRQLLSHQTGVRDYLGIAWYDSLWTDTARVWTDAELLNMIGAPYFSAGENYDYSNSNYLLLGMVINAATGSTWVDQLHTYILDPLTLDSTFVGGFEASPGLIANEWHDDTTEISNSPMTAEYTSVSAAGAILSTSSEMLQWYDALFNGFIISDSSLQEILNCDAGSFYGLGIQQWSYYGFDYNAGFHTGAMLGYISVIYHDIKSHTTICILTNGGVTTFLDVFLPMLNVLYNEAPVYTDDAGIAEVLAPVEQNCDILVVPAVTLKNYGSNTLTSATINYAIDGGMDSVYNWTGSLISGDTVSLLLPSLLTVDGNHTFKCYTTAPNGNSDLNIYNDTAESAFTVSSIQAALLPLYQGFENTVFPPSGWTLNSNSYYNWGESRIAPLEGNFSAAKSNYYDPNNGAYYDLDLPLLSIPAVADIEIALQFDYAYTNYPPYNDTLQIMISTDCGLTWTDLFYKGGLQLKTAPNSFYPFFPQVTEWRHETILITPYIGDALIRFRNICDFGNNLFIDQLSIDFTTGINQLSQQNNINVFPNPAKDFTNVSGLKEHESVQLIDITGKTVYTSTADNETLYIDLSGFASGVYSLKTEQGVKKICVLR